MDFCPPEVADKVGQAMAEFLRPFAAPQNEDGGEDGAGDNEANDKVVSLKVSTGLPMQAFYSSNSF